MDNQHKNKSVLIVEDHPVVAEATQALLSKIDATLAITICNCAHSAIKEFRRFPDWFRVFLNLDVPGAYGLSLARRFHELGIANRCAAISACDNPLWMAEAKGMGMIGYIVKTTPVLRYTTALKSVLDGHAVFPPSISDSPPARRLTRRQQDLLFLLQRGYSSKQIAAQLNLSEGTVNNHVSGLLCTLDVSNRTHALSRAMELGYIQPLPLSTSKSKASLEAMQPPVEITGSFP